jgi:hypothetical protein
MSLKMEDVEKLIKWTGKWRVVFVKSKGDHMKVRNGTPTPEFWELWRIKKDEIKSLGISVKKEENEEEETSKWVINAWIDATKEEKSKAQENWNKKMAQRNTKEENNFEEFE